MKLRLLHKEMSPSNCTDDSTTIQDKKSRTILLIFCSQWPKIILFWTEEHKSYKKLSSLGYIHDSVCHKKEFVNKSSS